MALTPFQREVVKLLATSRVEGGESYVAGGAALNTVLEAPRFSKDIDLFHDTVEAHAKTWAADRLLLERSGFTVDVRRDLSGFVQATVRRGPDSVDLDWVRDTAYRFFPLLTHPELGLTLHPFDLASNKVLALLGRREPRDWIDAITCSEKLQHLGYLAWAACGKDPGYGPPGIIERVARVRYVPEELEEVKFEGPPPDAGDLSRRWHAAIDEARELVMALPSEEAGKAVLDASGKLYRGDRAALERDLAAGAVRFHEGRIRGAFPQLS